mmetsp:Transcript_107578/g.131257  ORF Transcript_107578/g.131257 Transcript_107578/m.131257 type:complete len:82 (+) Transcript_107578:1183-1428(+)
MVCHGQSGNCFIMDQVLKGSCKNGEFMQSKPLTLQPVFKQRQHKGWNMLLQNVRGGCVLPIHPTSFQPLDVHAVALHKKAV